MAELPPEITDSPTVRAIYAAYEKGHRFLDPKPDGPRRYLGASQIGKECERALWFEFRWCGEEEKGGRMLRLLETGDVQELRLIADLRAAGITVEDKDEAGQQIAVSAHGGHFSGHLDGAALGVPEAPKTWHVLECKTHKASSFAQLVDHGVAKAKPEHFCQMQIYMHLTGMERALYLAVNKDTEELYAERVKYDKAAAESLLARALSIIESATPPERLTEDRDDFRCRRCTHNSRCHGSLPPEPAVPVRITCRSCVHATPVVEEGGSGRWTCAKHRRTLSETEQLVACDDHLFIPDLLPWAQYTDAGDDPAGDWIGYVHKASGKPFANTKAEGGFRSVELTQIPHVMVGDELLDGLKSEFGATVVDPDTAPFPVESRRIALVGQGRAS